MRCKCQSKMDYVGSYKPSYVFWSLSKINNNPMGEFWQSKMCQFGSKYLKKLYVHNKRLHILKFFRFIFI